MHERIVRVVEHIKRFGRSELDRVSKGEFGGDIDWGGRDKPAEKGPDKEPCFTEQSFLRRIQRFNPRQKTEGLFNTPSHTRTVVETGLAVVIGLGYQVLMAKLSGAPTGIPFLHFWR